MSPNLFHNNVKSPGEGKVNIGPSNDWSGEVSQGLLSSNSPLPDDQLHSMEQNTKSRMLRNNLKAENLKSKIDLLIMNKTKALPPTQDEAEENIQSIQQEINNLFTGRLNVAVTPNTPAMDAKSSKSSKLPMSPAKPGDSHFHGKHPTTVDNVEHLLETMFQDNKTSPAKANTLPAKPNIIPSKSSNPMVAQDRQQNVEHLLESMFQDSKSSSIKTNAVTVKPNTTVNTNTTPTTNSNQIIGNFVKSNILENKTSPSNPKTTSAVPENNVEHLLETMFRETKSSPMQANTTPIDTNSKHSNKTSPSPRTSLSVEAIESILRTPSPVDDEEDVKHSTRSSNSQCKSKVSNSPSVQAPFHPNNSHNNTTTSSPSLNNSRQSLRSSRLRKQSTFEEFNDDSSSDSTKLEIIDDYLSRSQELKTSADQNNVRSKEKKAHENNVSNNLIDLSSDVTNVNCKTDANIKSEAIVRSPSSNSLKTLDEKETITIKKEQPSPTTTNRTKAAAKESAQSPIPNQTTQSQVTNVTTQSQVANVTTQSQAVKNPIMAVENELEKMFAGIVKEEDPSPVKKETSLDGSHKRTRNNRRRSSEFFPSSPEAMTSATPPKRKKKSKQTPTKAGGKKKGSLSSLKGTLHSSASKDTSNDSLRGSTAVPKVSPFVRLYPGSSKEALVVNSIRGDDDAVVTGGGTAGSKKPAGFVPNKKMRSSAHSNLQPANRTDVVDPSWFCVFCRRGPNTFGPAGNPLGDLFGPYRIGAPREGYLDGDEFKRRVARGSPGKGESGKKKRCSSMDVDVARLTAGLTKVTGDSGDQASGSGGSGDLLNAQRGGGGGHHQYEVWFHEACVVWGAGVHLVGGSLMGLDQCVWAALNSTCVNCGETGASIGCVKSKCRGSVHYSCALHIGWYLDPTTFVATCSVHRENYVAERYLETPGSNGL